MLSQMEKQFVLGIMYVRRLRYLPTVTDNRSFLLHYIKKRNEGEDLGEECSEKHLGTVTVSD